MKGLKIYSFILIAFSISICAACSEDPIPEPTAVVSYSSDVAPIFAADCSFSGCHNSGSTVGSLENYQDAKNFKFIDRVSGALNREPDFEPMPRGPLKLSEDKIATIEKWIADGLQP
jgi:hypothetical protein